MNTKPCIVALSLCLSAECAAQMADPGEATSAFFTKLKQMEESIRKDPAQADLVVSSVKAVSSLKANLAEEWTTVIVSVVHDCSCTGPSYYGFCITRTGETSTITPWREVYRSGKRTGTPRPLTQPAMERLLSETVGYYLAASLSVTLEEKMGPKPRDQEEAKAWIQRYVDAGGGHWPSDRFSMEVRVSTPSGTRRHDDMLADIPESFSKWLAAFGKVPE